MIKYVEQDGNKVVITFSTSDEALIHAPAIHALLLKGEKMPRDVVVGKAKADDVRQVGEDREPLTKKATSFVEAMIGRILIKPDEFKYGGLIAIPDKAKRRPTVGTVVQVNLPSDSNPNHFEVGDRLVYGVYSGTPVLLTIDSVETPLIVLTPEEILVRLRGKIELKEAGQGY